MNNVQSDWFATRLSPIGDACRRASWSWLALVACGCMPSGDQPADTLPWNTVAVESTEIKVESPGDASTNANAAIDARELEFRDKIVQSCLDNLRRLAADPIIVEAVLAANKASWQSQQQIDQTDIRWRKTQGVDDPLVQKYMRNPCADYLRQSQRQHAEYVELFVMDDQGCVVAESDKTSDFWQGDEEKWLECFNGGRGQVYVGDVEYDQSTRSYVVQISVPVMSPDGATIGAMTVSVSPGTQE